MIKKVILTLTCMLAVATLSATAGTKKKVHTIGDSTMSFYATDGSTPKSGWGQMLQQYFNDNITINNRGKSGASSKSFYKEVNFWPTMVKGGSDEMQAGDFLLIQFAHNDEKSNGADGDEVKQYYRNRNALARLNDVDYRGTTPYDTYKEYMRAFIKEAEAMGVKPIVVGPICRKNFTQNGKFITRAGKHDLGDKFTAIENKLLIEGKKISETDHKYDYVQSAKDVANEFDDVPFIDLTTLTCKLFEKYGDAYCTSDLFCPGDKSHTSAMGSALVARTFIKQLIEQAATETDEKKKAVLAELAKDVVFNDGISFSPASGDMGWAYLGTDISKDFDISAFDLPSDGGKFTVSASNGFMVSTDNTNWNTSVDIPYSGNCFMSSVYVRLTPSATGNTVGKLTATNGTATQSLDLKVYTINKPEGETAECSWPMNTASLHANSVGVEASDVMLSEMVCTNKAMQPTSPTGHMNMLQFLVQGSVWPSGENSETTTRYIQFQAKNPRTDKVFWLDKISLDICGWGGTSTSYRVYYAKKEDFSDQILIGEGFSIPNKKAQNVSASFVSKVSEGGSFYIRVYPWMSVNGGTSNKCIAISNVNVTGVIATPPPAPKPAVRKPVGKKPGKRKK